MARSPSKSPRIRRSPEVARRLILDAAKQVLAQRGPGQTHLKAVADVAGVSHSLVTHYFGTIDALVEEVLAEQMNDLREAILHGLEDPSSGRAAVLDMIFSALSDPLQGRLMAWALLSGRDRGEDFFARRRKGLQRITDLLVRSADVSVEQRREIENRIVLLWCAVVGYAASAPVLWASLGVEHTSERDDEIRQLIIGSLDLNGPL